VTFATVFRNIKPKYGGQRERVFAELQSISTKTACENLGSVL